MINCIVSINNEQINLFIYYTDIIFKNLMNIIIYLTS